MTEVWERLRDLLKSVPDVVDAIEAYWTVALAAAAPVLFLVRHGVPSAIWVSPIDTTLKHDAMWRWDTRLFRHRHPRGHQQFDLVSLDLGRQWWVRYPEQDWIVRDWAGHQIGQYSLCPLKEKAFGELAAGTRRESQLSPDDLEPAADIHAHRFWYLANFMVARRAPRVRKWATDLAVLLMKQHAFERARSSKHFATATGGEISVVTVVEAASIFGFAKRNGFVPLHPGSNDAHLSKLFLAHFDADVVRAHCRSARWRVAYLRFASLWYRLRRVQLFVQPPVTRSPG